MRTRLPALLTILLLGTMPAFAADTYEQVYLSEPEAVRTIFGGDLKVDKQTVTPTAAQRTMMERYLGRRLPDKDVTFLVGRRGHAVECYGLILDEIGKHDPITFIVGVQPDLRVKDVAVMVFRERRGDGVKRRRFLAQFPGKRQGDPMMLSQDIMPISGSTMSSVAVSAGVKRALALTAVLMLGRTL
jgi:hypothetical protein